MKKKFKKWIIILVVIFGLLFISNYLLNNFVNKIVHTELKKVNTNKNIQLKIEAVKINIINSNLVFKNVQIIPDSLYFEAFKAGKTHKTKLITAHFSELKIKGFNILKILFTKKINLNQLVANKLHLNIYKSDLYLKDTLLPKNHIPLDSIYINGIHQIALENIEINQFNLKLINPQSNDTLFNYNEKKAVISGINIEPLKDSKHYFKIRAQNLTVDLNKQTYKSKNGNYTFSFGEIHFNRKQKTINIRNFALSPTKEKQQLANSYKYNNDIYNIATKDINIFGFQIDSIIHTNKFEIDSLQVDGLNLEIYKDQTKPFNLAKRPLFLNQKLKEIKQPLNIEKILVKNGTFLYQEKHEDIPDLMTITIADLNASIEKITNIKDSLASEKKLSINIKGNINKVAPLNLAIFMPYNSYNNAFSFNGNVGSAHLKDFNSAIYPALGAKIETGELHNVKFNVYGNPQGTKGTMTMIYDNVNATFIKTNEKHKGEKNKVISWITNTVIESENPSSKGKLRIALIEFERVPYKGFGNLIWKSFMSGMINTMLPTGKLVKEPQIKKQQHKASHKEAQIKARKHVN